MKKKIFKLLVIVLMGLVGVLWIIHYIHIDGISYIITDRTSNFVAVTHRLHGGRTSRRKAKKLKYRGVFTIPSSVNYKGKTYHVKSIGEKAFWDCDSLTSIKIPNSVTSIGGSAFSYCSGLTSITIPNSVTSIGKKAFHGCSSLKEVHITDLAAWCNIDFSNSSSNPLGYAKNLYLNRTLVTDLVIPDDVTKIKDYAFRGCSSLASITIPESVTNIGEEAFYFCDSLASVKIDNNVTMIGGKAFFWCHNLASINIPMSVTSIGDKAFSRCSSLKEVHITDLAAWCNIDFGDYNSNPLYYADNLYLNGTLVTDLVIPDGVTEIKDYAFEGCSSLASITIPNSVTSIGEEAFSGCSNITSITSHIPANKLFAISKYVFNGVNKSACTLYVPAGTKATYEATEGWKVFKNIVEVEAPGIDGTCGGNATW